jgi:oxygen-independent coproporphyrinogen-3 oxidase
MASLVIQNRFTDLKPSDFASASAPGLYVHIPFCFHKCHYCDFYSITRQTPQRMTRFVDLILHEADLWQGKAAPRTIFFGGGTPSLLPMDQMRRLITGLRQRFDCGSTEEWTIEVNPATTSVEYCAMLVEHGVDRLSFGAQSFDANELKILERHHDPEDVAPSLEIARRAGFRRLNVDLIYAIPGQSLSQWMRSLEAAIRLGTGHLSCYGLTYEPNTPMAVRKRLGHFRSVEESVELQMMHETRRRLAESGYRAYEISNYAMHGEECRHNLLYWSGDNYLGLGPSAASHLDGTRFRNSPHLGQWESAVAESRLPAIDIEALSPRRRAAELIMLRLRLAHGLEFADVLNRTGINVRESYVRQIAELTQLGLICADNNGLRLTETGIDVADAVAAEFMSPDL